MLNSGINTYFVNPTESNALNVAGDEEVTDHKVKCEFFYDGSQNLARFN